LLPGCGDASSQKATLKLWSPGVNSAGVTNVTAACRVGTTWLPIKWGPLPDGTKELVIYFGRFKYENKQVTPTFGSLLVGVKPRLHGLPMETFPPETFAVDYHALNSCPSALRGEHIVIELFARSTIGRVPTGTLSRDFTVTFTEDALGHGVGTKSTAASKFINESLAAGHLIASTPSP
jgi:hypothetical protein